jgi:hypothetical protein
MDHLAAGDQSAPLRAASEIFEEKHRGAGVWAGDPIFRRHVKAAGLTFSTSCSFDRRATWSTPLSERHLRHVVGDSRTTTTIPGAPPFCHYPMPCLIVAQPSARAPPLRVPFAAQALLHCMPQPFCPVGPLPVPKHARTHVHPSHPSHRGCKRFRSGPATPGFL